MEIKVYTNSRVCNSSLYGLMTLLALTYRPALSQLTKTDAPPNGVIARTTPPAAGKSGKLVRIKSGKSKTKSSVNSGTQATAKSKSPAPPGSPRAINIMPPKPTVPLASAPAPIITYLSQDAREWIHAGEMVHITMQGTPGGTALFRVIGLTENTAMQESAPGRYIGTWTVPGGKPLPMTRALIAGDLSLNGKSAVTMQASRPLCLDTVAPLISESYARSKNDCDDCHPDTDR